METTVVVTHEEFIRTYLGIVIIEAGEGVRNADGLPLLWLHILPLLLRHIHFDVGSLQHIFVHEVVAVVHQPAEILQLFLITDKIRILLRTLATIEENLGILLVNTSRLRNTVLQFPLTCAKE